MHGENNYDVIINNDPSRRPCSRVSKMTPVFTGRVDGPWTRLVWPSTRVHMLAEITTRVHGLWTRPVNTGVQMTPVLDTPVHGP